MTLNIETEEEWFFQYILPVVTGSFSYLEDIKIIYVSKDNDISFHG